MQKKLIALAVSGLVSGAAFAQANVTVYGAMDGTYDNVKATGATAAAGANYETRGRITANSSFIGFKGAETFGGLTAVFQIESGVGENGGATNTVGATSYGWANRDTYVALAGGFGTVAIGTLTAPARAYGAAMDVNAGATGIGSNAALIGKLGGGGGAGYFDQRFANAIAYISPTIGGFSAIVGYVPNENRSSNTGAGSTVNTSGYTIGLNLAMGPVSANYGWTKLKDKGTVGFGPLNTGIGAVAAIESATNNRLVGKYNFGMGTVGLLLDQSKAHTPGGTDLKQTVVYVPVTFTVGEGKIIAQYGQAGELKNNAALDGKLYKARHLMVGYEHSLSKRTIVKALYSQITNKDSATYDFLYGVSAPNSTAPSLGVAAGSDPRGFSVGIRHSF
jgi:predicted porin